ncbi:hypothetical protein BCR32DRAFT_302602 [Anaeromyces robustus]|uniref:Uncharacterized protein n=1 Tax=Anaeromyces robustus TaxID=1754192 RepID=A0A1Y1WV53_9FUNG|nr:hypothetical protein BCR32DRAFT_302602 [Anaeromyces robustus]|eukprot:ORX77439.1 hypothetical protein BCR32DRAFT_302602 [Anaeromyces robustus]
MMNGKDENTFGNVHSTPVGLTIDKYALAISCINKPENWFLKNTWANNQSNIRKINQISFENVHYFQDKFSNVIVKKEINFDDYWVSQNPFNFFENNEFTLQNFKIFLIKFADAIFEHRYAPENRKETLTTEYSSDVEELFMKLIYFRNNNYDIDSVLNEALPYCQEILDNPSENLVFAITNMYTERLLPKLFNENFISDISIYGQLYLAFNGQMLNKNIIVDQTVYYIQKRFQHTIPREIIKYALDIYNYPFPYAEMYDEETYKILDVLYTGKFYIMSNTNDRDIDSLSLWYNLHYEVNRKYHLNHEEEEITESTVSLKFNVFKAIVDEVLNIKLSNHPYLVSQQLTNINNEILEVIKSEEGDLKISKFIGSLGDYLLTCFEIAQVKDRIYLIPLVSLYNDYLYLSQRSLQGYLKYDDYYLMPISIPRDIADMNNYLLVESINKLKFVVQEIDNQDTGVAHDSLRLTFKESLPFETTLDPYSIYDNHEDTTENHDSFSNLALLVDYLKDILLVDIGNTEVTVFHENIFETVDYTSCQFIITQYEELIYSYKEIKNYLIFSENKNIIPVLDKLHSILQCLTKAEAMDYSYFNLDLSEDKRLSEIELEPFQLDLFELSNFNLPESLCKGYWWNLCFNTLKYVLNNYSKELAIPSINLLYQNLLELLNNRYNPLYINEVLGKISMYNEFTYYINNERSELFDKVPYFKSEELEDYYSSVMDYNTKLMTTQHNNRLKLSSSMKDISHMLNRKSIKSDVFRKGIFIMPGNITECSTYFEEYSKELLDEEDTDTNTDTGVNKKRKRGFTMENTGQDILNLIQLLPMFNNLAGSSTAALSQGLFNTARYIAKNYEATKVIPNFQPGLDMSFVHPSVRYDHPGKDYYYYANNALQRTLNSASSLKHKMMKAIDKNENLSEEEKQNYNAKLKKILPNAKEDADINPANGVDIQNDVLYEGAEDSGESLGNIFTTFNEVMDALGPEFVENELNDPDNSNIMKNYLKLGSQSNNILKNMMDEMSMSSFGIEGEFDKEQALKTLDGMKNPIAQVAKFYIKHDVNDKLKTLFNGAFRVASLGLFNLDDVEDVAVIVADSIQNSKARKKRQKRTKQLREKYMNKQKYSR